MSRSTVLWGGRRGDVQYGSRDFWRRNIPIGDGRVTVAHGAYFDVGDSIDVFGSASLLLRVTGKEGSELGVKGL